MVASDADAPDGLWVTEVWTDADSHAASLEFESVQAAIAEGRQYITGIEPRYETRPIGGIGLAPSVS